MLLCRETKCARKAQVSEFLDSGDGIRIHECIVERCVVDEFSLVILGIGSRTGISAKP